MRYYLIAGEASGDLHGGNLIRHLRMEDPKAEIRAWGGDNMEAAGAEVVKHIRDLAFMGFVEVIKHLKTILSNISFCKKDISAFRPDVLVLIDYPGFNLRIAEWAKKTGIKVVYYISPQVWAWKESRVKKIKATVDKLLVILPFEVEFYQKWNYEVSYVGHPLIEVVETERRKAMPLPLSDKPVIALLPGSRKQEIAKKLPIMLQLSKHLPQFRFVVAGAPSLDDAVYAEVMRGFDADLVKGQTYDLLRQAKAALVTSGTATLETALFGVPQVVCYKGNALSFWLAKKLVKVKYISLVNLIMEREVVPELIQDDLYPEKLLQTLLPLLYETDQVHEMKQVYKELWDKLGSNPASAMAAKEIVAVASGL